MIKRYWVDNDNLHELQVNEDTKVIKEDDIKDNLIEWHSVEEEPDDTERALIYSANDVECYGFYSKKEKCFFENREDGDETSKEYVDYWYYLPKPPKGE